jgi:hypothetical protein
VRRHITYPNAVATVCLFACLGGGAWAATARGGSTVHACYAKRGGAMRVARHCRRGERALSWNEVGPTGAPGSPGRDGAAGPAGPTDVSADGTAIAPLTGSYATFGQTTVPAGSYLLEAKASFVASSTGQMVCKLAAAANATSDWDGALVSASTGDQNVLTMAAVQTFASDQTVVLACRTAAGTGSIDNARLIAVRTQALHGSTPVD